MKVVLDANRKTNETDESYFIRLRPETNQEVASLHWLQTVFSKATPELINTTSGECYEVTIAFRNDKEF